MAAELPAGSGTSRPATAEPRAECSPEHATGRIARGGSQAANPEITARVAREVTHAINNALAVIVGNLELIASKPGDTERTLRLIGRALEAVQRATQHTQRLRIAATPFGQTMTSRSGSPPAFRKSSDYGASLLVVDDDLDVLEVARGNLSDLGYRVTSASNGRDALNHLGSALPIDLLFTDIVMPEMNGLQLTDEARRLRPGIKVLLTSGYAIDKLVGSDSRGSDLPPILPKPYRREQLATMVSATLDAVGDYRQKPERGSE
jgi:CheY-like chemotaxis protein